MYQAQVQCVQVQQNDVCRILARSSDIHHRHRHRHHQQICSLCSHLEVIGAHNFRKRETQAQTVI